MSRHAFRAALVAITALLLTAQPTMAQVIQYYVGPSGQRVPVSAATPLPVTGGGGGGGTSDASAANQSAQITAANLTNTNLGALGSPAATSDTGTFNLNAFLQRNNVNLTAVKTALGSPFQAGGSIGNTSFGISGSLPAGTAIVGGVNVTPFNPTGNATLAVTTSTARVALGSADATAWVQNLGNSVAYVKLGLSSVTAATTDTPILPGQSIQLAGTALVSANVDLAAITATGSTNLTITTGTGQPSPAIASDLSQASAITGAEAAQAAATKPPVSEGCRSATSAPTASADGQVQYALCGAEGKRVILPYAIKELQVRGSSGAVSTTTQTSIIASAGGSLKNYITDLECYNTSATTITLSFSDAATSVFILPAGGGFMKTFNVPLATAAATAFQMTESATAASTGCSAQGFTGL